MRVEGHGGWSGGRAEQAERAERAGMHWGPLKSFDWVSRHRAWGPWAQEPQSRGPGAMEAWVHGGHGGRGPWRAEQSGRALWGNGAK